MGSLKPWGCNDITSYRTNFWTCWIWCPRSVDNFPRDLQLAFFGGSESGSHKCCGAVHRLWEVCLALGVESQYSLLLNLLYNLILRQQRLPLIRLQPNNSNHDILNLSSDLFSDNNQNLSFFSEFIFNSHYMFRRSGPGHMLLHTVQKQKVQGRISLSLVKVKVKFAQTEVYKDSPLEKIDPLRSNPAPSPTVPLLHCPHGPSMPRFFSSFADTKPPPIIRAGQHIFK